MKTILTERDIQYNLRSENYLQLQKVKTTSYGMENIQCRVHHLWPSLPREIKDSNTLVEFKRKQCYDMEIVASAKCAKSWVL